MESCKADLGSSVGCHGTTANSSHQHTAAASAKPPEKVPTSLPPGEWHRLVTSYNEVTLARRQKTFPMEQLLGAESMIARMLHEHRVSKQAIFTGAVG